MATTPTPLTLDDRIRAASLTRSEQHVAQFMARNPQFVAGASAIEIGKTAGTSDASVVRAVKSLGYSGLRELRQELLQTLAARGNPEAILEQRLGTIEPTDGNELDRVIDDTATLLNDLQAGISSDEWHGLVELAHTASRIVTFGIGTAAPSAEYVSLLLVRAGIESFAIARTGFRLADDLIRLRPGDLVLVLVPLRAYAEIDTTIAHATAVGASSVVVSESLGQKYGDQATLTLSTPRTTRGTASEAMSAMVLGHALVLAVASHSPDAAKATTRTMNELRSAITGLDVNLPNLSDSH